MKQLKILILILALNLSIFGFCSEKTQTETPRIEEQLSNLIAFVSPEFKCITLKEEALKKLGNFAYHSESKRDLIIKLGILPCLIPFFKSDNPKICGFIAFLLGSLFLSEDPSLDDFFSSPELMTFLIKALKIETLVGKHHIPVQSYALSALCRFLYKNPSSHESFFKQGCLPLLLTLLENPSIAIFI